MLAIMDRALIDQYAAGAAVLPRAIAGLTQEDLAAHPVPGTWSIQQIVVHLLDSDLVGADRMKRIIAEDNPLIMGYNESRFAERLHYDKVDPREACEMFALNRRLMANLLRLQPEEAFERTGIHSENGKVTLGQLVRVYVDHLGHHLKFLHHKRRLLGKPIEA
jgi:uncharacterized damage-inducible protein DinB